MVKRKKPGSCSAQEEKRPEDISTDVAKEAGDAGVPNREVHLAYQLARTRSQNAPRLGSPSGQNSAEDGVPEKQDTKCAAQVQRSSLRVTKRARKDASPPPSVSSNPPPASNAAASKKSSVSKQGNADSGRTRRSWEVWSAEDKNAFFEAVCEFGKDFESIQSYIAQRSKKKGGSVHCIKNKDQVRHFYYRTWHKIAKVMNIGEGHEDVKKQTQELYGLINYAELRKKYSPSLNEKNGQLLTELVLTGSTVVKIRGKRIRIKTPVCRALKKINNVEETKYEEPPKLPADVWVEFRPRTNGAWVQVQSLAQNPRVRTRTSLQRRLSNVLEHLQTRWKPLRLRQKEQAVASLAGTDCKALALVEVEVAQELRVWPSVPISPVSISAMAASSLSSVSFQGLRRKAAALADSSTKAAAKTTTRPAKQPRGAPKGAAATATAPAPAGVVQDSSTAAVEARTSTAEQPAQTGSAANSETVAESSKLSSPPPERVVEESPEDEAAKSLTLLRSMLEPEPPAASATVAAESANSAVPEQVAAALPPPPPSSMVVPPPSVAMAIESVESILPECNVEAEGLTLGQLLGKAAEEARQGGGGDEEEAAEDEEAARRKERELEERGKEQQELLEAQAKRREEEERARERSAKGWTAQEAGLMTIGELYLMMGCPSKIVLHYDFCPVEQKESDKSKTSIECTAMLKKLLSLATAMFAEKNKQGPLSPPAGKCGPGGSGGATAGGRGSAASSGTPPSGKSAASRALGRSPSARGTPRPSLQQVQQAQQAEQALEDAAAAAAGEGGAAGHSQPGQGPAGDQHVFVVPMGIPPRTHKQAAMTATAAGTTANMLERGQLDRLVPANRRGVRMRPTMRKPLVVQRPLLPRADRRPVTLVQLLPSTPATLTAVVQPLAATAAAAAAAEPLVSGPKGGLVKLIHPTAGTSIVGTAFDVQPVQVPLMDAVVGAVEATSTATVLVASQPAQEQQAAVVTAVQHQAPPAATDTLAAAVVDGPSPSLAESANMDRPHAADALSIAAAAPIRVQPPSPPSISSLLDISLPESLPSGGTATQILVDGDTLPSFTDGAGAELTTLSALSTDSPAIETSNPLPSFAQVSESSLATAFKLACEEATGVVTVPETTAKISKTEGLTTPPMSPFKLVPTAPDPTWLNGESSDFSLSTLLNTLDSPVKAAQGEAPRVVPEAPILALETSTMDSISRMAPDVETHLQCLMNENSIDYVAKFADLAAQIASSNSESKST